MYTAIYIMGANNGIPLVHMTNIYVVYVYTAIYIMGANNGIPLVHMTNICKVCPGDYLKNFLAFIPL